MSRIDELEKIANNGSTTTKDVVTTPKVTVSSIDEQLGGHIGAPEMGMINNWLAKRHANKAQLDAFKGVTTEKYGQLSGLAVEALKAEAMLIREKLKVDFNHQFSAIAERAQVGQMTAIRKFEGVLAAGRELLYGDRADVLERLEKDHNSGKLTDEDFQFELNFYFNRYKQLRDDFVQITNEYKTDVRTAFRPAAQ